MFLNKKNKSVDRYNNNSAVMQYYSMQFAPFLMGSNIMQDTEPFYNEINKIIKKYITPESNVLEIGCGLGRVLFEIKDFPIKKGVGIDISEAFINECNKILNNKSSYIKYKVDNKENNLEFKIGDAQNLNFNREEFNTVICLNVIDRVPNPEKVIKEIEKVLKKEGILIICDPYDWKDKFTNKNYWVKDMKEFFSNSKWETIEEIKDLPFVIRLNPRKTTNYSNHLLVVRKK